MAKQFQEQGGAATMDPSPLRRWLTSKMMTRMSSLHQQQKARRAAEKTRIKKGEAHIVEYFHQVDDGYSSLAVQLLEGLQERYQIELRCHLVEEDAEKNIPEPKLLLELARRDARLIAPHYQLEAPQCAELNPQLVIQARAILANLTHAEFIGYGAQISQALWRSDVAALEKLGSQFGYATNELANERCSAGNARRTALKHYSGAMFYYGGEWYWGVDRLYHLEERLCELGLDSRESAPFLAPRPRLKTGPEQDTGRLTLEIYPSLRSPYTAIAFDRSIELAKKTGVTLRVLPVLPMVMRGVPATVEKGKYILFDTGREARAVGVPFGPCADPIGEPTRRAYSLWPWVMEQGKQVEFISAFLQCAWVDAVSTNNDKGLREVICRAGLSWEEAKRRLGQPGWEEELEKNRLAMYEMGLWGVPSYRLLGENDEELLALWGQDRLWLVAEKIQEVLRKGNLRAKG